MLWVILYATLFSLVHADGHDRTGATGVLSHLGRSTGGPGWRPISFSLSCLWDKFYTVTLWESLKNFCFDLFLAIPNCWLLHLCCLANLVSSWICTLSASLLRILARNAHMDTESDNCRLKFCSFPLWSRWRCCFWRPSFEPVKQIFLQFDEGWIHWKFISGMCAILSRNCQNYSYEWSTLIWLVWWPVSVGGLDF